MQLGGTGMAGAAVELEPDMNSSLVAGGTATRERVNFELEDLSIFERAADLTLTAGLIDAAADCDDVRDSTSRSRPLSKEPRWKS